MLYLGLIYWIVFPLHLNLLRDKPPLYLGTYRLGRGSILDRLEAKAKNPGDTLLFKIVVMIACLFILLDLPNPWA